MYIMHIFFIVYAAPAMWTDYPTNNPSILKGIVPVLHTETSGSRPSMGDSGIRNEHIHEMKNMQNMLFMQNIAWFHKAPAL